MFGLIDMFCVVSKYKAHLLNRTCPPHQNVPVSTSSGQHPAGMVEVWVSGLGAGRQCLGWTSVSFAGISFPCTALGSHVYCWCNPFLQTHTHRHTHNRYMPENTHMHTDIINIYLFLRGKGCWGLACVLSTVPVQDINIDSDAHSWHVTRHGFQDNHSGYIYNDVHQMKAMARLIKKQILHNKANSDNGRFTLRYWEETHTHTKKQNIYPISNLYNIIIYDKYFSI